MKNGTIRNKLNYLINKEKGVYTIEEIIDFFDKDSIFALLFIITLPTSVIVIPSFNVATLYSITLLNGTFISPNIIFFYLCWGLRFLSLLKLVDLIYYMLVQ